VAQALRVKQRLLVKPKALTIRDVYRTVIDMSKMKGVDNIHVCDVCVHLHVHANFTQTTHPVPHTPQARAARAASAT
jgi:hypothetical protein